MAGQIEIQEDELPVLLNFYITKLDELDKRLHPLLLERESIQKRLDSLKSVQAKIAFSDIPAIETLPDGYSPNLTIINKIKFALSTANSPKTSRQIIDRLFEIEPSLKNDRDKVAKNVSTVLSINQGEGKVFIREVDQNGNNLYSLNKVNELLK